MANRRKSEEEKKLQGTARNDRVTPDPMQPEPAGEALETPIFLNKTGRKHWKNYTKRLQNEGILTDFDLDSLARYCMHLQIADEAAEELKKGVVREMVDDEGHVYYAKTPNLLQIFNDASSHALKLEIQFGFTPASRKNIPAPKGKPAQSKLQKLKERVDRGKVFKVA